MLIKCPSFHQVKLAIAILRSHFLLRLLQIYDFQTTSPAHVQVSMYGYSTSFVYYFCMREKGFFCIDQYLACNIQSYCGMHRKICKQNSFLQSKSVAFQFYPSSVTSHTNIRNSLRKKNQKIQIH